MNVTSLFTHINAAYRGSDDDAPTSGTDFALWLATANRKISEYARDGKQTRASLFQVFELGTVSAANQSYDLDEEILLPADKVTVTTTTGNVLDYVICKPEERNRFTNAVYIAGQDPQTLTFTDTFTASDSAIGGTIEIAGYLLPEELTKAGDTVPVDDPYWLVMAVASELAFNDLTYESKANALNAKANALYRQMSSNNRRGTSGNPRTVGTSLSRIGGTE